MKWVCSFFTFFHARAFWLYFSAVTMGRSQKTGLWWITPG
jgi:hypothetical protein